MQRGEMVPDALAIEVLVEAMADSGMTRFLVDGFPATLDQLRLFEAMVGRGNGGGVQLPPCRAEPAAPVVLRAGRTRHPPLQPSSSLLHAAAAVWGGRMQPRWHRAALA